MTNIQIALWCNGSTPDSGSVCESSSLSKATETYPSMDRFLFFINVPIERPLELHGSADCIQASLHP